MSAAAARRAAPGTIFVDGAAQAEPFLDVERGVYNLDHHQGCVRAFTLAACEQALLLVRKGLDLGSGEWTVVVGEPDLDTVAAVWVLLNHRRLIADGGLLQRVVPLIRLEGFIDAHGLELVELSGLAEDDRSAALAAIDRLRQRELELKRRGAWAEADPLEHLLAVLDRFDAELYSGEEFADQPEIDELGRVAITDSRAAVLCQAEVGIYEAERHLRSLHGERLAIVILRKEDRVYTLRLVDAFLPGGLQPLYDALNRVDPAVHGDDRWSGSSEIGGSPRRRGTSLNPEEVLGLAARAYRRASTGARLARVAGSAAVAAVATALAGAACGCGLLGRWLGTGPGAEGTAAALVALLAVAVLVPTARRFPRGAGLGPPEGTGWLLLLPVAVVAGAAGGGWSAAPDPGNPSLLGVVAASAALAAACELLFRGALHGWLAELWRRPAQPSGGWRPSVPVIMVAALSAAAWLGLSGPVAAAGGGALPLIRVGVAGAVLGLACGIGRERSRSVVGAVVLHLAAALAGVGVAASWG